MSTSAAVIGIIIGSISFLLLIIIGLVVLFICRQRRLASKTTQRHQVPADFRALQESGHGLPIDIPVEALQREPPPRYEEFSTPTGRHLPTNGSPAEANMSIGSVSIHQQPPPPPYSYEISAVAQSVGMSSSSYFDSQSIGELSFGAPPPMYQSRVDLSRSAGSSLQASPRVAPRAGSSSTGRLRSIDSFMEFPSMSDILLTSSRSSLPVSYSAAAASHGSHSRSGTSSRRTTSTDSAHGDSFVSSPSSNSGDDRRRRLGGERPPQERSQSMSDIAVAHGDSSIDRNAHQAATSTECVSTVERRAKRAKASRGATRANCNSGAIAISSAETTDSRAAETMDVSCCVTEEMHERAPPRYATGSKQRRRSDDRSAGSRRAHRAQCHSMPQMATVDEETIQIDSNGIVGSVV